MKLFPGKENEEKTPTDLKKEKKTWLTKMELPGDRAREREMKGGRVRYIYIM